jgi:hypothetical protein
MNLIPETEFQGLTEKEKIEYLYTFLQAAQKSKPERFKKPTIGEVRQYAEEIEADINPIKFFNHYESNGWKVGENKMKNWKAAVRTWKHNGLNQQASKPAWGQRA